MPAAESLRRPSSLIQSLLQVGRSTTRTSTSVKPSVCRANTRSSRIASIAGQPE